jgi:hypothetical protein
VVTGRKLTSIFIPVSIWFWSLVRNKDARDIKSSVKPWLSSVTRRPWTVISSLKCVHHKKGRRVGWESRKKGSLPFVKTSQTVVCC